MEACAGGASGITTECEGSGAGASGNGATGCGGVKYENETDSGSRAGSASSDRGGPGTSILKELGTSLDKVGGSSSCKGTSERTAAVEDGRSDALIAGISVIEPLTSLKIEG